MMPSESIAQPTKQCSRCRLDLPYDAFWHLSTAKTGCQSKCKQCHAVVKADTRAKHLTEYREKDRAAHNAAYAQNPEKHRAKSRAFVAANPEKARRSRENARAKRLDHYEALEYQARRRYLLRRYAMSQRDFDALWEQQDGTCPICQRPLKLGSGTHIDHHHETGAIRGLLCGPCNQGIGLFRESVGALEQAIVYLRTC